MTSCRFKSRGSLVRVLTGFWLVAGAPAARGQEEEELPEEPSASERELESEDVGALDEVAADEARDAPAPAEDGEDQSSPLWETYDSDASQSIAQEVTGGVRVEDIVEPPSDFRFAAFGKPDPFVAPLVALEAGGVGGSGGDPLEIPIVSPLQKFSIESMELVGVWELATGERKAMILAGDQGIIVKVNDPVGDRGGKVLSIAVDGLTVREFSLAPDGTRQYDDKTMKLASGIKPEPAGRIRFEPGRVETQIIYDQPDGAPQPGARSNGGDAREGGGALRSPGQISGDVRGSLPALGPVAAKGASSPSNAALAQSPATGMASQVVAAGAGLPNQIVPALPGAAPAPSQVPPASPPGAFAPGQTSPASPGAVPSPQQAGSEPPATAYIAPPPPPPPAAAPAAQAKAPSIPGYSPPSLPAGATATSTNPPSTPVAGAPLGGG